MSLHFRIRQGIRPMKLLLTVGRSETAAMLSQVLELNLLALIKDMTQKIGFQRQKSDSFVCDQRTSSL